MDHLCEHKLPFWAGLVVQFGRSPLSSFLLFLIPSCLPESSLLGTPSNQRSMTTNGGTWGHQGGPPLFLRTQARFAQLISVTSSIPSSQDGQLHIPGRAHRTPKRNAAAPGDLR